MLIKMWLDALFEWSKFLGYSWYVTMRTILLQVFSLVLVFLVILWIAVFMYGSFYYTYMPQVDHERDVHFVFKTDCQQFQKEEQFCSFPSSNFTLTKPNQPGFLTRGQAYVVSLDLVMPESPVNKAHGMFLIHLHFYTHKGEPVQSARRTSMLRYKSFLFQMVETVAVLPSLLIGSTEEKQIVTTELFEDYQEDSYKPSIGVFIEVQSKQIEIYSAKMRMHARFTGLRYLLFHWPLLSAFTGVSVNMFFLCIVAMLSWYQITYKEEAVEENGTKPAATPGKEEKHKRVRALLERERQKEREALKRELGLVTSSSAPNLHKRAASLGMAPGMSPLAKLETVGAPSADDLRGRSLSMNTDNVEDDEEDDEGNSIGMEIRQRRVEVSSS